MDNADYTDVALRLANADLTDVDGLRAALHDEPWWSDRATAEDLAALTPVAAGLRRALDRAAVGDGPGVLHEVNALLAANPLRPRLSAGHNAGHTAGGSIDHSASDSTDHVAGSPTDPATGHVTGHVAGSVKPANWHVHVADVDAPPGTEVAAAAAWGMAHGIVHYGLDRWGRCGADGCGNYYLDTSSNRTKRFCSPRCANRVHVAAFRSRRGTGQP